MREAWLKIGCRLIGYNYPLLKSSSIGSEKAVIKYTSAVLLVCMIWAFIGFNFTNHYLHGGLVQSILGALVLAFIVIQIERQIILTVGKNQKVLWLRAILAIAMAFIGSIIIDQMIFREDVEREKVSTIQDKVNEILPKQIKELSGQIRERDSIIKEKENQIAEINTRVSSKPTIPIVNVETISTRDSTGKFRPTGTKVSTSSIANPEQSQIPIIQSQIDTLRNQKSNIETLMFQLRDKIKADLEKHPSFFDELNILFTIIFDSLITAILYIALWLALFIIELLVLFSKISDRKNDYEKLVEHQMNVRIEQLRALSFDFK
jgi:hypothetical protein